MINLLEELKYRISFMHEAYKERTDHRLLIAAAAEIELLRKVLSDLMPFVLEDYYPNCATPAYKAAVEAAIAIFDAKANKPNE
jgi:hypothetical protein